MQPFGQERVGVQVLSGIEGHTADLKEFLQAAVVERVRRFGAAADMFASDKDLGDGWRARQLSQRNPQTTAPVILLVFDRIQIDRAVLTQAG
jgi:hypothetical protein